MFLTADTHFGHQLMGRMRGFGNAVEAHDEELIRRWNRVVTNPRAPVWHLGDFAMGQDYLRTLSIFERLNGVKTLVRGNHDGSLVERLPWDAIVDQALRRHERRRMTLCHYRWADWPGRGHGGVMLYGHRHGSVPPTRDCLDVGVDCWDLAPVHVDRAFERMAACPEGAR